MTDLKLTHIKFDVDTDGVATVLLDRAGEQFNSLGPELAADLFAAIEYIETDSAIKAVVIGSAKKDNFLSGADIRWLKSLDDPGTTMDLLRQAHAGFMRLEKADL